MRTWALPVFAMLLMAGCAGTTASEPIEATADALLGDPLAVGGHTFSLLPFDMGERVIEGAGPLPYLLHIRGEVTVPDGDGPFPLVVIMHGRHSTCALAMGEILLRPCPDTPVTASVESYTGYRYLADNLASHGLAVISVDANNVNDHDNDYARATDDYGATARANLILAVLDEIESGTAFETVASTLDLGLVGLMGHSRGGEGVIRAATLVPERIDAVMALAPTDFARWVMPSQVAFGTILPYCDGDVSNLQGAWAYDDAPGNKHQFLHMGANHNYYNTIWTRDDWGNRGDPYCDRDAADGGRLTPDGQEEQGLAMMGAFFRYYLGDGEDLWPLLEGSQPFAFDVKVSSDYAVGHSQHAMVDNDGTSRFHELAGEKATPCTGTACPIPETYSTAPQLHLKLAAGQHFTIIDERDMRPGQVMSLRIGVHQDTTAEALAGLVAYAQAPNGTRFEWRLSEHGLFVPPGDGAAKTTLNMVWLPYAPARQALGDAVEAYGLHASEPIEFQFADWYELDAVPGGPRFAAHY